MKLVLIVFFVLTALALSSAAQETPPVICRGKPLSITLLPGPPMTSISLPLRFGGTRPFPLPYVNSFPSDNAFRLVIKNRDEFSGFWKRLTAPVPPGQWIPPLPEIDFSKEMIIVSAMGRRPSSGFLTIIDGACEADGQVEVFVGNVDSTTCAPQLGVETAPADAVRIPRTDLPIVFRETQIPCTEWLKVLQRSK